jgi:hypothetical protein
MSKIRVPGGWVSFPTSAVTLITGGLLLAAQPGWAQSPAGTLTGSVLDEQDRAITGATVTLADAARGQERQSTSDDKGTFSFTQLPPSTYQLRVERTGFAITRFDDLVLSANDQRSLRIRLAIAGRDESVTVTAEASLVRESPAVATVVNRQFIANQPLNGRTFQTLINLAPGVVMAPSSLPEQGQFSVNGQRTGTNYFTVDGVSANFGIPFASSPYEGSGGGTPSFSAQGGTSALASVDAVQEFTIQTSTYAPEYGRQPGAQVAIVTRSGTNALHGTLFHYLRNDKFDANSWFGNLNGLKRPALRQNDFGGVLGGPVVLPGLYNGRNRTFFFVSYEGLRLVQPMITQPLRVPSLAARERATGLVKMLLEAYPLPVAPPLATAPDETPYVAGYSNPSTLDATSLRVDHALTSSVTLFGRYNYAPSEGRERGRYATPSFVAVLPARAETVTVGSTQLLNPRLNNDLRLNWSRSSASQEYVQDTFGGAKLLPRELLFPSFAPERDSLFYLTIGANDENTISPGTFSRNTQRQFNIVDAVSWNVGAHSLKFGGDYRSLSPSIGGRLYSKVLTVPTITQLASGIVPSADIRQTDRYLEPRYNNTSLFMQDAWRVSPQVMLTYGFRWEVNPAPGTRNDTQPLTLRGLSNPSTATLAPPGSRLYETTYRNIAPRLGISFRPFRDRDTVLRAGWGIFYDLGYAFTGTALTPGNYPYSRSRTLANVPIGDPALSQEASPLNPNPPYPRLFAYAEDYRLPYTRQLSVAVEQPFGRVNSLSVSYVGAAGRRLARVESLRAQVLQNPNFTRVDYVNNDGNSDYHSLQTQFQRRFSRGLQALLSYTWAKSLDTASDESIVNLLAPAGRLDPRLDRGPSTFDIRHAFTGSASYELPTFGSTRFARAVFGGFALDSIVRLRTAPPVNLVTGRDPLGLGLTNVARPDLVPGQPLYLYSNAVPGGRVFNTAAFDGATPLAQGRQGTLGRNVLRGFNLQQVDLAARRRFRLAEDVHLQFRADAFNLFNTPNFASPIGQLTSPQFGRSPAILSTGLGSFGLNPLFQIGGPRSLQLALKLEF